MTPTLVLVHSPLTGPMVWLGVADAFEEQGIATVVPELHDHGPPYWPQHVETAAAAVRREAPAGPLVLVAHSGAGALMPPLRRALDSRDVAAVIFVDAGIPHREQTRLEALEDEGPEVAASLAAHLAAGGRFPEWSDEDLADEVPDPVSRAALIRSLRPRGSDYWTEPIPVYTGWPDMPCGFVLLSDAYRVHAERARTREWPVVEVAGGTHFRPIGAPSDVATAILSVTDQVLS